MIDTTRETVDWSARLLVELGRHYVFSVLSPGREFTLDAPEAGETASDVLDLLSFLNGENSGR